jgi:hypothetical protein
MDSGRGRANLEETGMGYGPISSPQDATYVLQPAAGRCRPHRHLDSAMNTMSISLIT